MKTLLNKTNTEKSVFDAGDSRGRTVPPQTSAEFTDQGARELLASFPSDWAEVKAPKKPKKED